MASAPILIATDFSDASQNAIAEGSRIAKERGAPVLLVHAVARLPHLPAYGMSLGSHYTNMAEEHAATAKEEAQKMSDDLARPLRDDGLEVRVVLEEGTPEDVIQASAKTHSAQMIVLGSHGWKGFKRFVLGSVAQTVLHDAKSPVLVVPTRAK